MSRRTSISLEDLGLSPSADPMEQLHRDDWFEFPGYFRKPAHTQIEIFGRASGGYRVVIATELAANKGVSITNGSESLAKTVCERFHIKPEDLVMVEHYYGDNILPEHYDLVKFNVRRDREGLHFDNRHWMPLDKEELERLIGGEIYG